MVKKGVKNDPQMAKIDLFWGVIFEFYSYLGPKIDQNDKKSEKKWKKSVKNGSSIVKNDTKNDFFAFWQKMGHILITFLEQPSKFEPQKDMENEQKVPKMTKKKWSKNHFFFFVKTEKKWFFCAQKNETRKDPEKWQKLQKNDRHLIQKWPKKPGFDPIGITFWPLFDILKSEVWKMSLGVQMKNGQNLTKKGSKMAKNPVFGHFGFTQHVMFQNSTEKTYEISKNGQKVEKRSKKVVFLAILGSF